jgi:hypothetical protein
MCSMRTFEVRGILVHLCVAPAAWLGIPNFAV